MVSLSMQKEYKFHDTCFLLDFTKYLEQCWSHAVTTQSVLPENNSVAEHNFFYNHCNGN